MPLTTNVQPGDPGHADLHNEEREEINDLQSQLATVADGIPSLPGMDVFEDDRERTIRRLDANSTFANGNGRFLFSLFRASRSRTVTNVTVYPATTGVGITRLKLALFSVDEAGLLARIGITENDAPGTLSFSLPYTRALVAPVDLDAGVWYAVGVETGATTAPSLLALNLNNQAVSSIRPILSGIVNGNSDMPDSVAQSSYIESTSAVLYAEIY